MEISTSEPGNKSYKRYHNESVSWKRRKSAYGEKGGHVEAEKHVCIVEEVANTHGSWWTRESGYNQLAMQHTKGVKSVIVRAEVVLWATNLTYADRAWPLWK